MTEFDKTFNPSQQFLMYQAYLDNLLTEDELMNFTLLEDEAGETLAITSRGLFVLHPNVAFDQFTHDFYPKSVLVVQPVSAKEILLQAGDQEFRLAFKQPQEAEQFVADLGYLME